MAHRNSEYHPARYSRCAAGFTARDGRGAHNENPAANEGDHGQRGTEHRGYFDGHSHHDGPDPDPDPADSLQEMVEVLTTRIQQQMKEIMDKEAQNTEDILTAIHTMMAQIQTQLIHCKRW